MSQELETVAEFLTGNRMAAPSLPWQSLRNEDVRVLREWAGETLPYAAQRRLMRDLRRAVREPLDGDDGLVLRSAIEPALLRAVRRTGASARLAARQAKLLLDACEADDTAEARRDGAVIALMLGAGLRRTEVVALQRNDFDDDEGRLRVTSDRRHARSVMLDGPAKRALDRWLSVRGGWSGPLIAALNPRGEIQMRGLRPSTINRLLATRAGLAGCAGVTPRDLRGRFLWQLQSASRERPVCRYYQDENGQPAWVLAALMPA